MEMLRLETQILLSHHLFVLLGCILHRCTLHAIGKMATDTSRLTFSLVKLVENFLSTNFLDLGEDTYEFSMSPVAITGPILYLKMEYNDWHSLGHVLW